MLSAKATAKSMTEGIEPPAEIKLFPIRGCILLPGEALPLNVFEPRYLNMVDDAMDSDRYIAIVQPVEGGSAEQPALAPIGTAGRIASFSETEDGRYLIVLEGVMRFRVVREIEAAAPYRVAEADYEGFEPDLAPSGLAPGVDREKFLVLLREFFDSAGLQADWDSVERAPLTAISDKVAMAAPFDAVAKQALLEAADPGERVSQLAAMMSEHLDPDG